MFAASALPGSLLPVLGQTFLVWQFLLSSTILRVPFKPRHYVGTICVVIGLIIVNAPTTLAFDRQTLLEARVLLPARPSRL